MKIYNVFKVSDLIFPSVRSQLVLQSCHLTAKKSFKSMNIFTQ